MRRVRQLCAARRSTDVCRKTASHATATTQIGAAVATRPTRRGCDAAHPTCKQQEAPLAALNRGRCRHQPYAA
eukprot:12757041-Alexandrium_andersonii.AAC.1